MARTSDSTAFAASAAPSLVLRVPPVDVPATTHVIVVAVDIARRRQIDITQLLAGSELAEDQLRSPTLNVNRAQELRVFSNLLRLTNDASLGLAIGRQMHVSCFGLPGYTMLVSGTVRDAFACLRAFPLLMGLYFDVSVNETNERVEIEVSGYGYERELELLCTDMCLAAMIAIVEDLSGCAVAPLEVSLRHGAPGHLAAQRQVYGCKIDHGANKNSIAFPAALFDRQCPLANVVSFDAMHRQCTQLEREWVIAATSDFATRLRQVLAHDLPTFSSIGRLAAHLCMTERTLSRRLKCEGLTFQQLIDETRRQRASEMLARGMKVADVAEALGYSDSASFRHAFRRWSGVPPSTFRERCSVEDVDGGRASMR
ncbi:putative HTH-type transcriptional regulator [Paraburkholderia hiiakae]|uniref:HTH-type transcriptional regulator n=1 Tax=Paraburkholderia hiiakae TaxID=1081782 RepID=A0ABM8NZS0_9BURK|nr:AraC family transcriptional regulator [Paraburkholderia hiiakae]CAD6550924.1 putative HTH-type transcriptional regulator [Paraburkholderia hiiakae]